MSVAEARAIDRDAVERLGMPVLLLMENAARGLAEEARKLGRRFVVLCGPGNNGGDGLAAARHLGSACSVHLLEEPDASRSPEAALQLAILRRAGRNIIAGVKPDLGLHDGAVWIDAMFGTGLTRPLGGLALEWTARFNAARGPKLAADIPTGLDGDTGVVLGDACRADVTVTFHAPKIGMLQPAAAPYVGRIVVVPLGLP